MRSLRSITLLWPGLPWVWLRGNLAGFLLAAAFAIVLDMAIATTWIWTELVDLEVALGLWTASATIWIVATVSAVSAFPPAIATGRDATVEALYVAARDAYLSRDWLTSETKLRTVLELAPTDGEAQLLLATLLRRVGRRDESRLALEKLSRSDSGGPWRSAIAKELELLARPETDADESPAAFVSAANTPRRTAAREKGGPAKRTAA